MWIYVGPPDLENPPTPLVESEALYGYKVGPGKPAKWKTLVTYL